MDNAVKVFSVDVSQAHTEDTIEQELDTALRAIRTSGKVDKFFAYSATQVYVIVMDSTHQHASVWALTSEFCTFGPVTTHVCAGAGAMIRCLGAMTAGKAA